MSAPKALLVDIETFPNVGFTWGKYEQTVLKFKREWSLASFAYKELGRGRVQALARPDFKDPTDEALVRAVRKVVDEADVLIGHNIDGFDLPKLRAKFVQYGMKPTSHRTIDTLKIARSQFSFNSNKLDDLVQTLGLGRKVHTGGFDLWERCMAGDAAAWRRMVKYNKHDVRLLEAVYKKFRAWYPRHVNFAMFDDDDRPRCPVCQSTRVQRRGYHVMVARRAARFACQKCGHWFARAIPKSKGA